MPHRALCGLSCGTLWHAFALLLAVSKMPLRHPVCARITFGLNPAGVSLFRMHAAQSPLRTELWHALARFCFAFSGFEDAVSALSLRTNYLPLGLESCWGFPVSHACRTRALCGPIAARFGTLLLCFYRFRRCRFGTQSADELPTPWAWILLGFPCFGCMPHRALCGLSCGTLWHAFALFLAVSKMPFRHPVCGRITYPLGLNPAGVSLFRMHAAQSPLRTELWHALARFCFVFSGFEDAVLAPSLRTNYLPLGLESCWGFPVSDACRTEPFADWVVARFGTLLLCF